jgi:hypothetical protein
LVNKFYVANLRGSWVGNHHPLQDLAKFGYWSKKKVGKFSQIWVHVRQRVEGVKNHAIFLRQARTYCLNMTISKKFPRSCEDFGPFFLLSKKSLCIYPTRSFFVLAVMQN